MCTKLLWHLRAAEQTGRHNFSQCRAATVRPGSCFPLSRFSHWVVSGEWELFLAIVWMVNEKKSCGGKSIELPPGEEKSYSNQGDNGGKPPTYPVSSSHRTWCLSCSKKTTECNCYRWYFFFLVCFKSWKKIKIEKSDKKRRVLLWRFQDRGSLSPVHYNLIINVYTIDADLLWIGGKHVEALFRSSLLFFFF